MVQCLGRDNKGVQQIGFGAGGSGRIAPVRGSPGETSRASRAPGGSPAPLRASPRCSAQAAEHRGAFESAVGSGRVGGGAGGRKGGRGEAEGLSETKEFLKISGEMRAGTRRGRGFAPPLGLWGWFYFPTPPRIIFVGPRAQRSQTTAPTALSPAQIPSPKAKQGAKNPIFFTAKREGKCSVRPGLGARTIKP